MLQFSTGQSTPDAVATEASPLLNPPVPSKKRYFLLLEDYSWSAAATPHALDLSARFRLRSVPASTSHLAENMSMLNSTVSDAVSVVGRIDRADKSRLTCICLKFLV